MVDHRSQRVWDVFGLEHSSTPQGLNQEQDAFFKRILCNQITKDTDTATGDGGREPKKWAK